MTKEEIEAKLTAAGIEYDGRLSAENLAKLLPETEAPVEEPVQTVQMVDVIIKRDTWDAKGIRHPKGSVISVPMEDALDGVEAGRFTRAK